MTDLVPVVKVNQTTVPLTSFRLHGGGFGSVGHCTIDTSLTALLANKIDLFSIASGSPGAIEVDVYVQPADGQQKQIFGGEYLRTDYDIDNDLVRIHARDWAGTLVDQRRVLTKIGKAVEKVLAPLAPGRVSVKGISNENQQIGNIVNSIADEFGFTAVLNLSDGNPTIGTLYGSSDQSFIIVPQNLWSILNQLARDSGYDVYVTPDKKLVFGAPGAGLSTINLTWNILPGDSQMPCRNLHIEHHPRRNSTFRVLVISHDPTKAQATLGRATYIGPNFAGQHGLSGGMNVGGAAIAADKNILGLQASGSKIGVAQIPLYTFNVEGLTADQANVRAQTIAADIAKRELILSATIDGVADLLPTQPIKLTGDVPNDFVGQTYYVSAFEQSFRLPEQGGHGHGHDTGWISHITALNIPTEALAKGNEG